MKPESKNRWMIWAIVILALTNISTIITILYHRHNQTESNLPMVSGRAQSENASLQFSGRYFRDQLNLTRDQMASFRQFNPEFRTRVRNINISLAEKRHQMLKEMAGETSDNARLDALSDSIGILHAELKKLTYRYYMDFKKICDKQQQQKLEQLFGEMFNTDIQTGRYGQRGPYGRGFGREIIDQ